MSSHLRVGVVIAAQLAILALVPARQIAARRGGTPVTLRTAPVDPFDVLAGHYVTLSYEVERASATITDPGLSHGDEVWITVKQGTPAWTLDQVTRARPDHLSSGTVSIRARWQGRWNDQGWARIEGAERFYVPEDRARALDAARRGSAPALVELRVGRDGTPAVVALWVGDLVVRDE